MSSLNIFFCAEENEPNQLENPFSLSDPTKVNLNLIPQKPEKLTNTYYFDPVFDFITNKEHFERYLLIGNNLGNYETIVVKTKIGDVNLAIDKKLLKVLFNSRKFAEFFLNYMSENYEKHADRRRITYYRTDDGGELEAITVDWITHHSTNGHHYIVPHSQTFSAYDLPKAGEGTEMTGFVVCIITPTALLMYIVLRNAIPSLLRISKKVLNGKSGNEQEIEISEEDYVNHLKQIISRTKPYEPANEGEKSRIKASVELYYDEIGIYFHNLSQDAKNTQIKNGLELFLEYGTDNANKKDVSGFKKYTKDQLQEAVADLQEKIELPDNSSLLSEFKYSLEFNNQDLNDYVESYKFKILNFFFKKYFVEQLESSISDYITNYKDSTSETTEKTMKLGELQASFKTYKENIFDTYAVETTFKTNIEADMLDYLTFVIENGRNPTNLNFQELNALIERKDYSAAKSEWLNFINDKKTRLKQELEEESEEKDREIMKIASILIALLLIVIVPIQYFYSSHIVNKQQEIIDKFPLRSLSFWEEFWINTLSFFVYAITFGFIFLLFVFATSEFNDKKEGLASISILVSCIVCFFVCFAKAHLPEDTGKYAAEAFQEYIALILTDSLEKFSSSKEGKEIEGVQAVLSCDKNCVVYDRKTCEKQAIDKKFDFSEENNKKQETSEQEEEQNLPQM